MKITMIGAGYVGLVSGICFAQFGHQVTCVDTDTRKVAMLKDGAVPIYEPGLEDMLKHNVAAGRLDFSADLASAVKGASAVFIGVGTPSRKEDGRADLSYVFAAAETLARHIDPGTVVVTKSTVPVGTNAEIYRRMKSVNPNLDVSVASNPEFLREGSAIVDFMEPDRIVLGAADQRGKETLARVYDYLTSQGYVALSTDLQTAEMIKYAANAFLATKITFINEMSEICEAVGADVEGVARGMGLDSRIGPKFLQAGPGYGGSCFPKDTSALLGIAEDAGTSSRIVHSVIESNAAQKRRMISKISKLLGGEPAGKRVAVMGVTFKPETDDMRDAPALTILPALHEAGADLVIVDPEGEKEGARHFPWAQWESDPYVAAGGADMVVILTEWGIFQDLDLERIASSMRTPLLADLRNLYSTDVARNAGFSGYESVGRARF